MDKRKNNTIKIKLNNESSPVLNKPKLEKAQLDRPELDRPQMMDPQNIEGEPPPLEETAATLEAGEEAFDWILPEEEPVEHGKFIINEASDSASIYPKQSASTKRKNGSPIKPAILTIVFAIIVGVGLGAGMWKLVFSEKETATAIQPEVEITKPSGETKPSASTIQLPPLSAFVVQEGIYSSKESAEIARKNLEEKGIPAAVLDKDGQGMLLAGIAGSIESANGIGEQLTEKGIAIYAKEVTFSARQKENVTSMEKQFLAIVPEFFEKMGSSAGLAMEGKTAGGTAAIIKELDAIDASKLSNPDIKTLYSELAEAAKNLETYEKTGNRQNAIAAQSHLLNFIAKYQAF
ncbi:SPOR domain-containing protein [Neobacillus sp. SCS-31]|uniref:SPOR domain-containing protein n=1 Tax=Neobacillus oceani TaxID=3115292 RepID=UPI003906B68E